jgi:ribosomal RNA-processing protein 1
MTDSTSTPPLGKYLASSDKATRDKAIKKLSTFLSNSSDESLPPAEMAKLWKGIFYCFWMSDKPLVQQALAEELAELLITISTTTASLAFLRGFWETIVREWNGIDRLRIDKYYMLVRRFLNASFRLLMGSNWDASACDEHNIILSQKGGPLW